MAEKLIFSLPNDFQGDAAREALGRVLARLVADSDAVAYGVIHTDRPDNLHCHILAVDGPESVESAQKRRPGAKRTRRQDQLRMGNLGRPKELRAMIAEEINVVATKRGLTMVEHRSFEARGIERLPGSHMGPQRLARAAKEATQRLRGHMTRSAKVRPQKRPPDVR